MGRRALGSSKNRASEVVLKDVRDGAWLLRNKTFQMGSLAQGHGGRKSTFKGQC